MKNILLESEILIADSYLTEFYTRIKKNIEKNPSEKSKEDAEKLLEAMIVFKRLDFELKHTRKENQKIALAFHKVHEDLKKIKFQNEMFKKGLEI